MKHETPRASQLNGCAFCVDVHVKEATLHGERTSKPRDGRA
jgi:AhpD family alkylhydroperoxidase